MFCPNCGSKLDDDAKFCGTCGEQIVPDNKDAVPGKNPPNDSLKKINWFARLYDGRIGRGNWALGIFFGFIVFMAVLVGEVLLFTPSGNSSEDSFTWLFLLSIIVFWFFIFSLHIRRLHDLDETGWKALLFLIPLVNLIMLVWLLSAKGTEGGNKYGDQPPKNAKFFKSILNLQ